MSFINQFQKVNPMLTIEERDVVVAAMRKYPAGVRVVSWGKSDEFFYGECPKSATSEVESLPDSVLLEGG